MPIKINNNYLVPAPLVSINKQYNIGGDGVVIGTQYSIDMEGTLLPTKGNPVVNAGVGSFSTDGWVSSYSPTDDPVVSVSGSDLLETMMLKQEQIRNVFASTTGVKVEITSFNNDKGIKFFGFVNDVNFGSDGRWANPNKYNVSLVTNNFIESVGSGVFSDDSTEEGFTYYIDSIDESWSIQEGQIKTSNINDITDMTKTYEVTHDISIQGKPVYDENGNYVNGLSPFQQASGYAHNVLGLGEENIPSDIYNDPSNGNFDGFVIADRVINENISEGNGNYSINETFFLVDSGILNTGFAVENVTVDYSEDITSKIQNVTINGTIQGLSLLTTSNSGVDEYTNALTYFGNLNDSDFTANKIYLRAKNISGLSWLNPKKKNFTITKSPKDGTVSYTAAFDTRMPTVVSGALSESINISDTYPGQNFSVVPVIGGSKPVIQYINSRSEYKRSLSISAVMPLTPNYSSGVVDSDGRWGAATSGDLNNWFYTQKPSVANSTDFEKIYNAVNPANEAGVTANKVFHSAPQESWNPFTGQYTYNIEWTYNKD